VNVTGVLVAQGRATRSVTVTGTKNLLKPLRAILAARNLAARHERKRSMIEGTLMLVSVLHALNNHYWFLLTAGKNIFFSSCNYFIILFKIC
jgi:hypothetical protein